MFLNLKNLFSHCFSTFFPFHKLRLCSYIGKFWHNYVIRIKTNKKTPFIPIPAYYIPLNFPTPLFITPPPDNLGPKSSIFLTVMGLICPLYNSWTTTLKVDIKKETHELYTNTIALLTVNTFNLIDINKVFH